MRLVHRGFIATAAAASLFLMNATPAFAAGVITGSGAGTGGDFAEPDSDNVCDPLLNPTSAFVDDYQLEINNTGTYSGAQTSGTQTALYVGTSHILITAEPHYISPIGTHDPALVGPTMGASCLAPQPVDITATVTSPGEGGTGGTTGGGAGINCPEAEGTMTRVQSAVTIEFSGTCTVKGQPPLAGTVTASPTFHVLEGTLTPCYLPPPITTSPENEACTAQRAATPPGLEPYPPVGDPGSLWLGTYEAAGAQL